MARAAPLENSSVVFKDGGSSSSARRFSSDRGSFSEKTPVQMITLIGLFRLWR
jgi:hypothetical protein